MALFSYKAIDGRGKSLMGQIEAINLIDLELRLQRMGLDLIVGGPARRRASMFKGAIGRPELINFCFHLEQLTGSGVPIIEALIDLRDSVENPRFREVLSGLTESIQGGMGLSAAMSDYPDVFPKVFASLIRAGEETGRMSQVLKNLADNLRWEDELIAQTKKLMIYPAFVGSIVFGVTMFLMIYLVPQMIGFIKSTGQAIPLNTRMLIATSGFFIDYWWAVLLLPVVIFAGIKFAIARDPTFRYKFDNLKLRTPYLGPILHKIILSRFASIFAMMYSAGITILDCIKTAEEIAGNLVVVEALQRAGQQIAEGKNVSNAFQDVGLFPPLVIRMLRV
ncbi:MAG: type II secretion system F family protein, partial [Pseudomonadota bacterium]